MRPLIIGREEISMAAHIVAYAKLNIYSMDDLLDILNRQKPMAGDDPKRVCILPHGYRCVFSIEDQTLGRCRHLSVSVDSPYKLPNHIAVRSICLLFEIKTPLEKCQVEIKPYGNCQTREREYVDIVELIPV